MIRLAACQYAIELHETWDAYADHLQGLCAEAVEAGHACCYCRSTPGWC